MASARLAVGLWGERDSATGPGSLIAIVKAGRQNKYYLDRRDYFRVTGCKAWIHSTPGARACCKVVSTNLVNRSRIVAAALLRGKLPDEIIEQVR